jgi:hypothetical protein
LKTYMKSLDAQLDLIRHWKGPQGPIIGETWVDLIRNNPSGLRLNLGGGQTPHVHTNADGAYLAAREVNGLNQAATYWVSPSIVDLFDSQRERLPSYELRSTDIPSRHGFAYLAHPIYLLDCNGHRCNVRAFSWAVEPLLLGIGEPEAATTAPVTRQEVEALFDLDVQPPTEYEVAETAVLAEQEQQMVDPLRINTPVIVRADGTWLGKCVRFFVYSDRDDPHDEGWGGPDRTNEDEMVRRSAWPLSLLHVDLWMLNQPLPEPGDPQLHGAESFLRVVASFWTFCNQKIVVTRDLAVDRHLQRRAIRQGFEARLTDIRVVTLRREEEAASQERPEANGEPFYYSHSFIVGGDTGGFLRNQWYPSEGRHKPIWIDPYIRGDGPLVVKDVVYRVTR